MDKITVIIVGCLAIGFIIGKLREKWVYFSKTGKHLQDLKSGEDDLI